MKKYDKIRNLSLKDVFNSYIENNNLSIAYAAKSMKIPYTSLLEWLKGLRGISQRNAGKIRNFLKGKYVIDVDTVVNYLLMQKEQEDFDLDKIGVCFLKINITIRVTSCITCKNYDRCKIFFILV